MTLSIISFVAVNISRIESVFIKIVFEIASLFMHIFTLLQRQITRNEVMIKIFPRMFRRVI